MSITIKQVKGRKQLREFIQFRYRLYRDDPNYVPELYLSERIFLSRKNPFFNHSEVAYFLASHKDRVVGRVAAILNNKHLERYEDGTGFFGFFDAIDDQNVCDALLHTAGDWLKDRNVHKILGPENFTTNHAVGILVEGFNQPPVVQMPYNKPYYEKLLTGAGMTEKMELYAYRFHHIELPDQFLSRALQIEERLAHYKIRIRPVNFKHFKEEMEQMRQVYNAANEDHWGFVPLTSAEFMFLAGDLRQIVRAENVLLAEKDSRLIGYLVTVPDVNQIFIEIPEGKLWPFGWTKLVWKPKVSGSRMLILGVLPAYRNLGIDWCFYARSSLFYRKIGVDWTEACYVMKNNLMMNRIIKKIGGERAKTYRVFEREI